MHHIWCPNHNQFPNQLFLVCKSVSLTLELHFALAREEPFYLPVDNCGPGDIRCTTITSESCLPIEARCNGTEECLDGWDEAGCPSTSTGKT